MAGATRFWDDIVCSFSFFKSNEHVVTHLPSSYRRGVVLSLPPQHYHKAWDLQRELCSARLEDDRPDTLVLVEHPPVFTLGRRTKSEHWGGDVNALRSLGYEVVEIERGGSVTYHGPGQIVGYPILRLREYCAGPKVYVGKLEEVLMRVLGEWGIQAWRHETWRGVWVGDSQKAIQKIAAVGVRITRGVTMHGFALNVNVDLKPFELITPCGIEGCQVTSMAALLGQTVDMAVVRKKIAHHFGEVFGLRWIERRVDREKNGRF